MRDYTIGEMIADCEATMKRMGRTLCPFTAELKQHPDWTMADIEAWLSGHDDLCAPVCCDILRACGWFNDQDTTADLQVRFAKCLVASDWIMARVHVETLLHQDDLPHGLAPEAALLIIGWLDANHPNPDGFFAQELPAKNLGIEQ